MEYPDWIMIAGAVLLVVGFIGFCISQNRLVELLRRCPEGRPPRATIRRQTKRVSRRSVGGAPHLAPVHRLEQRWNYRMMPRIEAVRPLPQAIGRRQV